MALGGALCSICSTLFMVDKHHLVDVMQALRNLYLLHDGGQAFGTSRKTHEVIRLAFHVGTQPLLDIFLEPKIDATDDECVTGMGRHRGLL